MSISTTRQPLSRCHRQLRQELLDRREPSGHWSGHLSSSALATATAVSALAEYQSRSRQPAVGPDRLREMIDKGVRWCLNRQNTDGGWGDTDSSHSNIATTMLVLSALKLSDCQSGIGQSAVERAQAWCSEQAGGSPAASNEALVQAVQRRYGQDKTFAVPILANCAIAGLTPWSTVAPLPCEAALVPQRLFRFFKLPVVSYAIPALVSIGQARFLCAPPRNPLTRLVRRLSLGPGMKLLTRMQPASGGFLEAIPLTSFVGMSLAHSGRADHRVTANCVRFIDASFRDLGDEGTWPIDTNLATWNTTLAINALGGQAASGESDDQHLTDELLDWVLSCQYQTQHPYTGAAPGGWGWSNLSGAVPDADDTPGALLALRHWWSGDELPPARRKQIRQAASRGVDWLLDLQNRDQGWPTFCRGWGRLPFDRSGTDITAHVLRALLAWQKDLDQPRISRALNSGFVYLQRTQHADGSWSPLWFGNQDHPEEDNPIYGTCKVLLAWRDAGRLDDPAARRAITWLIAQQNADGGWGGGPTRPSCLSGSAPPDPARCSSLQETALVCEVLASSIGEGSGNRQSADKELSECGNLALQRGVWWLSKAIEREEQHETWPIGFYFAKLWYYEALYPLIFATSAFRSICQRDTGLRPGSGVESVCGQDIAAESNS